MKFRRALMLLAVLALGAGVDSTGAEATASGLTIPFFDDAGRPTHRLNASSGRIVGAAHHLREVEIVYFSAKEPNVVVQRLEAREATWDATQQTLTGKGPILVATVENRLTGDGFDFALATNRLNIHRDFTMLNAELELKSDRAVVDLNVEKSGEDLKVRDVKRCEAIGHLRIAVQPTAKRKYHFEQAFSDRAIYDGTTQKVTMPNPTRTLNRGVSGEIKFFELNLREEPAAPKAK